MKSTVTLMQLVIEYYGGDCSKVKPTSWRSINCPFHSDEHASARISLEVGGFRCLAAQCGVSGDALKIISKQEGISRADAEQWAHEKFGEDFTNLSSAASGRGKKRSDWHCSLSA